ncbi:hypothetical protein CEXT_408141 [Caerostris extrusa]|uniref:Uncharacterized protein n=1 Tax=Caerostris extrusa TaxID=172846 RepID=A0AAV4NIA1_CAEEX|nr:hypothetical protein CEXT_408141 [Caerostris extrusa]
MVCRRSDSLISTSTNPFFPRKEHSSVARVGRGFNLLLRPENSFRWRPLFHAGNDFRFLLERGGGGNLYFDLVDRNSWFSLREREKKKRDLWLSCKGQEKECAWGILQDK